MKIIVPFSVGGPVDLYKFFEYMRHLCPEGELTTIEDHLILRLLITEGYVKIGKKIGFKINFVLLSNGSGGFIIELDSEIEEVFKDTEAFLFRDFEFHVKDEKKNTSFYSFMIKFMLYMLRLEKIKRLAKVHALSNLKKEVVSESGIDFLLKGKEDLFLGFGYRTYIMLKKKPEEKEYNSILLNDNRIYFKGERIFYISDDETERKLLLFILIAGFYDRYRNFTALWTQELKKDITTLREGIKIKGAIEWEWEQKELEIKKLNLLDFFTFYRTRDTLYSQLNIPQDLQKLLKIDIYKKNIEENIRAVQFMIEEIGKIVNEKQTGALTAQTKRVEYLLTMLGVLGGLAAILAALFSGNIGIVARVVIVSLLLLMPVGVASLEFFIRRKIRERSRRAYINTRVENLLREKMEIGKILKAFKMGEEISGAKAEIIEFYQRRIQEIEAEIEDLKS